ncbi:MAG: ABC transporter ATP-binding protein, partial [Clostridia bacterium]
MKYDKIATYFRLNLAVVIVVIISGMFFDGLMWIVPLLQGDLINSFAQGQSFEAVALCATYFLGVVLFIQLNRLVKRNYVREFANRAKLQMRERAFSNLLMTDRAQLNTQSKGQIATIILSDIEDTVEGMRKVTTEIFDSIVLLIGYIISMFVLDWRITLCVLPFFVVSALSAELLKKKIYHSTANYKREYSKYKSHTLSLINNDIFLRGTGAVSRYQRQYEETVKNLENSSVKSLIYKNAFAPLYSVIAIIGIVFVIVLGAGKVQDGVWDIGEFSAYIATFMLVATKISKVGKVFNAYTSARVSWVRCKGNLAKKSIEHKTITVPAKLEISNL